MSEAEPVEATAPNLWDSLADDSQNISTMVYYVDLSFPFKDEKFGVREVFAATTKDKAIAQIHSIITHPDVIEGCDFDVKELEFKSKLFVVKEFFAGNEDRNLFIALVPVL